MRSAKSQTNLVRRLLDALPAKCAICKAPATKSCRFPTILGDDYGFCSSHGVKDTKWWNWAIPVEYQDLEQAPLVQEAQEWLANRPPGDKI